MILHDLLFVFLFDVVKALIYGFDPYIQRFIGAVNVPRSYVPVFLAMQ